MWNNYLKEFEAGSYAAGNFGENDPLADTTNPSVFDLIEAGKIPGEIFLQTERAMVIKDIAPAAPVHLLVVPKTQHKAGLFGVGRATHEHESILGHLLLVATEAAAKAELGDGYRIVINEGKQGC